MLNFGVLSKRYHVKLCVKLCIILEKDMYAKVCVIQFYYGITLGGLSVTFTQVTEHFSHIYEAGPLPDSGCQSEQEELRPKL